ncbi:response regulator [bacterium]|nr:response regulator [bacterium]
MQGIHPGSSTGTILLLDDEFAILETSKMMLELLGYTVTGLTSAQMAIKTLQESQAFDLILTDLDMPDMDGREFAREARKLVNGIPVVVVSGYVLDEEEWSTDFDGILTKPFRVQDLKSKVDEFIVN